MAKHRQRGYLKNFRKPQIGKGKLKRLVNKAVEKTLKKNIDFDVAPNSSYTKEEIFWNLIDMAVNGESAESRSDLRKEDVEAPSPDTMLYHLHKLDLKSVQEMLDQAFEDIFKMAMRKRIFKRRVVAALDFTDKPYYGDKDDPMVVGTKPKAGTSWAHRYANIHLVEKGERFTLKTLPMGQLTSKIRTVEKLLEDASAKVDLALALMDRGFFSVEMINLLEHLGQKFLMPAKRNSRINRLIEENKGSLPVAIEYEMKNQEKEVARFTLALTEKDDRCYAYATNLEMNEYMLKNLPAFHSDRWGIETGYRMENDFLAVTTTKDPVLRYLYFLLSCCLYNIWVLCNFLIGSADELLFPSPVVTARRLKMSLGLRGFCRACPASMG